MDDMFINTIELDGSGSHYWRKIGSRLVGEQVYTTDDPQSLLSLQRSW